MSKSTRSPGQPIRSSAQRGARTDQRNAAPSPEPHWIEKPPLKPRPLLMKVMGIVLIIWFAILLAAYFLTVYPARHGHP